MGFGLGLRRIQRFHIPSHVWVLTAACCLMVGCTDQYPAAALLFPDLLFNITADPRPIVVSGDPVFKEEALFGEISGKVGHHAATITAFPDGELFAAWYSYSGVGELDGSAIYTARRPVGEAGWQPAQLHIDRSIGDGNPVLYSEGDAVWLFQAVIPFGWSTAHVEMQRSFDRGITWTSPKVIAGPLGLNTRYPPIRLQDGRLLLPAYDDLLARTVFLISKTGDQWTMQSVLEGDGGNRAIQPSVVQIKGGRILAVMRNGGGDWLWISASDDAGRSWSKPIDSGFPNPGSATALSTLADGNLVLVYNDSRTTRRRLCIAMSGDDGMTWPHHRIVADGDEKFSYPSVVQSPDGLIHIVYSLSRRSIQHVTLNKAWIVHGDSGASP